MDWFNQETILWALIIVLWIDSALLRQDIRKLKARMDEAYVKRMKEVTKEKEPSEKI
jgi:hypothetical protein